MADPFPQIPHGQQLRLRHSALAASSWAGAEIAHQFGGHRFVRISVGRSDVQTWTNVSSKKAAEISMLNEAATTHLLFGALVSSVGFAMIVLHVVQRRKHQEDASLSDSDSRFYDQQYRRRMQTSALTVTLGALIGLCGYIRALETSPVFATCYGRKCWRPSTAEPSSAMDIGHGRAS